MNIAILNCSSPFAALDHHGSAAHIIEQWLSPHFIDAKFTEVNIACGDEFPASHQLDGVIVSGSEKGVYDKVDWMEPLKAYLRQLRDSQVPIFGICFGHQVMAEAFGGKAAKAEHGFVVGSRDFSESIQNHDSSNHDSSNRDLVNGKTYSAYAMHKDQVVEVPDSATVTASAPYCPVAALNYSFPARSVQFHPEFQSRLVSEAIEVFDGDLLTHDQAEVSRQSMTGAQVQQSLYADEIAEFFRQNGRC